MVFEGSGTTQQKKPDLLSGPTGRNILPVHVWQKKIFFEGTQQKMQTKKGSLFLSNMDRKGGPRQQVSIFCFKKVRFFCKAWTGRIFLPVGPDNRFKVFQRKTGIPSCPCLFHPFSSKKDEKGWKRMKKDEKVRKPWYPFGI